MKSKTLKSLAFRRLQADSVLGMTRIRRQIERRIADLLAAEGLGEITPAQANAMMVLFQAREPITAKRLADELALTEPTVARFVRALEDGQWVERRTDPADNRARLLLPTPKAYAALPGFINVSNTMLDEAFEGFSPTEIEAVAAVVGRLRTNLGA